MGTNKRRRAGGGRENEDPQTPDKLRALLLDYLYKLARTLIVSIPIIYRAVECT